MYAANQNREAIKGFVDVFLQRWWQKYSSDCFVLICWKIFSFYFPNALESNNYSIIRFMFLGINIFWTLLRAHFNHRLTAWAKMGPSRAQNIFYASEHRLYCFTINQWKVWSTQWFVRVCWHIFPLKLVWKLSKSSLLLKNSQELHLK